MAMTVIQSKVVITGDSWHNIPTMLKLVDSGHSIVSKPWNIAHSLENLRVRKLKTERYKIRSKTVF